MSDLLADKVIAVTGAGRGIGRAVALAAADEGAKLVVADFGVSMAGTNPNSEVASAVAREIERAGGEAIAVAEDVRSIPGADRIIGSAVAKWGRIDGVVAAAGILRKRVLFEMSEDEWDDVIAAHLKGHFTIFRVASEAMVKQGNGGTLVGFTSHAYQGVVDQPNYSAAKGGIVSLVRSAAAGLKAYGITANAIAPTALTRMSERMKLLGRTNIGDPEDIAPMAVYLLSNLARHVTGQVFSVAGSRIAVWNQPVEVRAMFNAERWSPEAIARHLDTSIGQEPLTGTATWDPDDPNTAPTVRSG